MSKIRPELEAVAKAIYEAWDITIDVKSWSLLPSHRREPYFMVARVALRAIETPSEGMIDEMMDEYMSSSHANPVEFLGRIHSMVIRYILSEREET